MPEAISAALAMPGLWILLAAVFVGGLVYGFAGFGAALVFMPIAALVVTPAEAIAVFVLPALGSAALLLPEAMRLTDKNRLFQMLVPSLLGLVLGLWILRTMDVLWMRWCISIAVLASLALMMAGWRRAITETVATLRGVGAAAGFFAGATGMAGPVIILFNLSGHLDVARMRANTLSFLTLLGVAMIPIMAVQGMFTLEIMVIGAIISPVYMVGNVIGRRIFNPSRAGIYRALGYGTIFVAGVMGLPIWE